MGNILLAQYLTWQFFDVPKEIIRGWKNYLVFGMNFFSVPLLLKTFFSHWRRLGESYGKGFSPSRYASAFVFNAMSRVIGMIMRTVLIIIGILLEIIIFFAGAVVLIGWVVLPVLLVAGFIFGISRIL